MFFQQSSSHINFDEPVDWNHPINRGLLGWWMALPYSGGWGGLTLRNIADSKFPGTLTNGPTWGWDRQGKFPTVIMDGTNDYVNCGNVSSSFGVTTFTVEAWVLIPASISTRYIAGKGNGSNDGPALFTRATNNRMEFRIDGSTIVSADNSITSGQWVHVAGIRDAVSSGTQRLYVNGTERASTSAVMDASNTSAFYIGTTSALSSTWNSAIKDVRLLNRAYSADEVAFRYRTGLQNYQGGDNGGLRRVRGPSYFFDQPTVGGGNRRRRVLMGAV